MNIIYIIMRATIILVLLYLIPVVQADASWFQIYSDSRMLAVKTDAGGDLQQQRLNASPGAPFQAEVDVKSTGNGSTCSAWANQVSQIKLTPYYASFIANGAVGVSGSTTKLNAWASGYSFTEFQVPFQLSEDAIVTITGSITSKASGCMPPLFEWDYNRTLCMLQDYIDIRIDNNQNEEINLVTPINFKRIMPARSYGFAFQAYLQNRLTYQYTGTPIDWSSQLSFDFNLTAIPVGHWYGLFIGLKDDDYMRGDSDADLLDKRFMAFSSVGGHKVLPGDLSSGGPGLSRDAIEAALKNLNTNWSANDTLFFYISSHGINASGLYIIQIGHDLWLEDSELYSILATVPAEVRKLIVIDACYSGAFWGTLKNLKNTAFVASSAADKESFSDSKTKYGLFTQVLLYALAGRAGHLVADVDHDGIVTIPELLYEFFHWPGLNCYINNPVFLRNPGDQVIFTLDKWTPQVYKTDDFIDGLPGLQLGKIGNMPPLLLLLSD